MALASGAQIGPYTIGKEIGSGGMGIVYRATDTNLKRDVAIKALPDSLAADAERLARFQREAEVLASLNHPNIAQIHGLEKADGTTALVMELVEGPTLADRIAKGPLPPDEALGIAMQIADALEAAHGQNIVHRDLKPANIKLKPDGTVKVLDFGIAKALESDVLTSEPQSPMLTTPATQVGVILGTAAYMSPEQAKGQPVDQRADIWAFGCVLYEMLTGQLAFGAEDVPTTLARVIDRDTDMDSLPTRISPAVRHTISLCLQKDVRRRVADIRDVKLGLEGALESERSSINDSTGIGLSWSRQASLVAASLLVGSAVVGFTAFRLWPSAERRPVNRFEYELPEQLTFRNTGRPIIALSPDGRDLVYNSRNGFYLRPMGELEARVISGTEVEARAPAFSPDGQSIVYYDDNDNQVKRIAISGGVPVAIADVPSNVFGLSWGVDDTILIGQPEGIYRVSANSGTPDLIIPTEEGMQVYGPRLLPDGDSILFSLAPGGDRDAGQVVAQSLSTGERTVLIEGGNDARYISTGHLVYALGDGLFARAFDPDNLTVLGGPVPVVQGVMRATGGITGAADYDISEEGTLVYVPGGSGASQSLVWVNRDGREEAIAAEPSQYLYPRLSPDGKRVALDDRNDSNDVWVWDFESETRTRLTIGENGGQYPVWTADMTHLAYSTGPGEIAWKAANNTGLPESLYTSEAPGGITYSPYFFAPSGTELVYRSPANPGTLDDIGMVTIGGSAEPVWLLRGPYIERNAELSPDGRWMAYQSNESGMVEIYVRPFPDVDRDQVQVSNGGGWQPAWARDGRELFYLTRDPERLMAVSIDASETTFSFGPRVEVLNWPYIGRIEAQGRPYDVADDGRFLAIKSLGQEYSPRVIVVENWFDELERLVPTE